MKTTRVYVGHCQHCDCVTVWSLEFDTDGKEEKKDTAKTVADIIKRGDRLEVLTPEQGKEAINGKFGHAEDCPTQKRKRTGNLFT